jgi:hypothetical protein
VKEVMRRRWKIFFYAVGGRRRSLRLISEKVG